MCLRIFSYESVYGREFLWACVEVSVCGCLEVSDQRQELIIKSKKFRVYRSRYFIPIYGWDGTPLSHSMYTFMVDILFDVYFGQ